MFSLAKDLWIYTVIRKELRSPNARTTARFAPQSNETARLGCIHYSGCIQRSKREAFFRHIPLKKNSNRSCGAEAKSHSWSKNPCPQILRLHEEDLVPRAPAPSIKKMMPIEPQLKVLILRSLAFVRDDTGMVGRSKGYRTTWVSRQIPEDKLVIAGPGLTRTSLMPAAPSLVIVPHPQFETKHFAPPWSRTTSLPRPCSPYARKKNSQSMHRKRPSALGGDRRCAGDRRSLLQKMAASETTDCLAGERHDINWAYRLLWPWQRDQYFFHYFTARGRKE